ncbi:MAG: IS5 family transposase [Capnocytophaga sp.]|nr:IS5 family transposase [Capnocytophaga sp.]
MDYSLAKVSKKEFETKFLPLIPKNKRGFASKFNMFDIFRCIVHKLKTGCQWNRLFVELECVRYPFSYQSVYYFYKKWCKEEIFKLFFQNLLIEKRPLLDTEKLNLDGTHSLVKKAAQSADYQHRKKGRTSNVLILTDGNGRPIALGDIMSGNHNDLYDIVPQFSKIMTQLRECNLCVENSYLIANKGFDSKKLRRAIMRRKLFPNIKENKRNRKGNKRGRKRFFQEKVYKERYVNERCFAWLDSFKTLLIRFDFLDFHWLNWHYLSFALVLLKV